ncbi:hypothetical protein NL676_032805 [Syzygium grande]|nr:hypothetical protein NL676_032805 [Syzygium grande]
MGFDNECILNIQSLAGEYFCPVCRLLVYPNEALQSQCTHLYCKPCLAYIASSTKACPYDGYLVTEADSKLLIDSNKALAETISKIPVHCLYHRSGCTWQGPLSECVTHCAGCAFGNSPVVCNRCGIQIVHRQVQEHAQSCPGVHPQVQPAEGSQEASGTNTTTAGQGQSTNQAGTASSQASEAQTSQTATPATSAQQVQSVDQAAILTPEQWYQHQQQHYNQYYQQYIGYDPYQQQYQQYYPYQQPAILQPQLYAQPPAQPQSQSQPQAVPQPQVQPQPQPLPQPHTQPKGQPQAQTQVQPQVYGQLQLQLQPHAQSAAVAQSQNPQQQLQPNMPLQSQVQAQVQPSQALLYPQSQSQPQPQYPILSHSQPHAQVPQHQQPQAQAQYPHPQTQPQAPPQLQLQQRPVAQVQQHLPTQPGSLVPPPSQAHPHPQVIQGQSQTQHPSVQAVTGYQSYPQTQPLPQAPQQHIMNVRPHQQAQQFNQMQGQFPQPSPHMNPAPQVAAPKQQQQPALLPSPAQNLSIPPGQQQQGIYSHTQQPGHPVPQRAVIPPFQPLMPQQYPTQQPSSGGQPGSTHQGTFVQQQQVQSHLRPHGPLHSFQPQFPTHPQPQQSVGRPTFPNQGIPSQFYPQSGVPVQVKSTQAGFNLNNLVSTHNQVQFSLEQQPGASVSEQRPDLLPRTGGKRDVVSSSGTDSSEMKMVRSETEAKHLDDDHKAIGEPGESNYADTSTHEILSEAPASNDAEHSIKRKVKGETTENMMEPSHGKGVIFVGDQKDSSGIGFISGENVAQEEKGNVDSSSRRNSLVQETGLQKNSNLVLQRSSSDGKIVPQSGLQDRNLPQPHVTAFAHGHDGPRGFPPPGNVQTGGRLQSSHPNQVVDQRRHQAPPPPHGSSFQHRPAAPPMLQQPPLGPPQHPPMPGHSVSHHGPPSFGNLPPGQGPIASFGRGQGQFGPQSVLPQGIYNQGLPGFGPAGGIAHKQPNNLLEAENYPNQRPVFMDGRQTDSNLPRNMERVFGHPSEIQSNLSRMGHPSGFDSALKSLPDERFNPPSMDPSRRGFDRGPFEEDTRGFRGPYHPDAEAVQKYGGRFSSGSPFNKDPLDKEFHGFNPDNAPNYAAASSRNFQSYDRTGVLGERALGHPEDNPGRLGSSFGREVYESLPSYSQRHKDGLTHRSPGGEYSGIPSLGFEGLPGVQRNPPDDNGRREPRLYGAGSSFPEGRFPALPNQFHKSQFEDTRNLRMGEHLRNGSLGGDDFIRKGDTFGSHDLPTQMRMGEPGGLGTFHSHTRVGEPVGLESIRGSRFGHPRFGETGFRSSFPLQGHPNDGKYTGDLESFENSRKRKAASMGWCRICKVDCETVEGLDLHSQTREHQKIAMDMVRSIKQQNAKKQKISSSDRSSVDNSSKLKNASIEGQENKHKKEHPIQGTNFS